MTRVGVVFAVVASGLIAGCDYVVVPPEESGPVIAGGGEAKGWTAVATSVGPGDAGDLRIDLTIRNDTRQWSAMEAVADKPAILTGGDGASADCDMVVVGSGGHRLAPGFQMRGFTGGPKTEPTTELIRVECPGVEAATPGSTLALDYSYVTGEYNYYDPDSTRSEATLEVALDEVASDLTYPIGEPIDGLIQPSDLEITAINDVLLTMADAKRTDTGLELSWRTTNPGEYPSHVHIGNPPVIGSDGILYGFYESPDLASVPVTPAAGDAEWTTEVTVPADVTGLYIPLSVESKKQRLFVNYALDVTDR